MFSASGRGLGEAAGGGGQAQQRAERLADCGRASEHLGDIRLQIDGHVEFRVGTVKLPALALGKIIILLQDSPANNKNQCPPGRIPRSPPTILAIDAIFKCGAV